ncbi:GNAT family N-acetyltransferase [Halobacillus massiliensis]|uniref:GNAT family N-acetyltransferase n=1 Tax=Halobacillus massiliensis TaxID=1926286 RepID=UPI0009E654A6|nr:GNAT family N-acetyltransferase [Halobacillus massiliensis]
MKTIQRDNGIFYIEDNEQRVAELAYEQEGSFMVITHTQVSETEQGRGLATELVENAVNFAREHGLKIKPVCSFAKTVIDEHSEFQDVLEK